MQVKHLIAGAAALACGGAFAAVTPVTCNPATAAGLANTCVPEVVFLVGGASAQQGALEGVLKSGTIFDNAKVRAKLSIAGNPNALANGNTFAYIGIGATGTSYANKRVAVIYNKANGSAAGVATLLTGKGTTLGGVAQNEHTLWTKLALSKELAKGVTPGCTVDGGTEGAVGTLVAMTCSQVMEAAKIETTAGVAKSIQMALSDVRPSELSPGIIKKWDSTKFPATTTGLQGFGVIVNAPLYAALIKQNVADGILPASCDDASQAIGGTTDAITAACQPTLKKADYASVITGKYGSAADWFGSTIGGSKALKLFRRVDTSGTQAASNIFFAGQAAYNAKDPANDGFATLVTAASTKLSVTEGSTTGAVISGVSGEATDMALGVVSLENYYSLTKSASKLKGAAFVKLDGISPNFKADGTVDLKARSGLLAGYPFAFEMVAVAPTLTGDQGGIATKIVNGLKDPANDLAGIAYIGSSDTAKNAPYTRNGNNYLPLSK